MMLALSTNVELLSKTSCRSTTTFAQCTSGLERCVSSCSTRRPDRTGFSDHFITCSKTQSRNYDNVHCDHCAISSIPMNTPSSYHPSMMKKEKRLGYAGWGYVYAVCWKVRKEENTLNPVCLSVNKQNNAREKRKGVGCHRKSSDSGTPGASLLRLVEVLTFLVFLDEWIAVENHDGKLLVPSDTATAARAGHASASRRSQIAYAC